ncbi:heavy metal-binding domain-containing protein [Aeromicrobium sp. PE09-221]|uniref:heavy metal-binding domain-containing protein n=1 Tax=Aeromicrobium sp. PE09-221 TaxID=1898043 RepID=UPI000B3E575F|nr:heavy metal-binding domain-containing protein [Aeromicrobium sp. PE09-221]OUZ12680.1 heavy metal-binding domain-containing protein [Aeromicrobium sp. PE09-221]
MRAPARLTLYGIGLIAVFAVAFATASAVVPEDAARDWAQDSEGHGGHDAPASHDGPGAHETAPGLGLAQDGYRIADVGSPGAVGEEGELSFLVLEPRGGPVTDYELEHEHELHLIVVRADGQLFRHVHPERDDHGTWSIPWEWAAGGTYRLIADFTPASAGKGLTLSTTTQVAGDYSPVPPEPSATATVDGYEVGISGDLVAGESSELAVTVARDGEPVTDLEPHLGAFGHLVALREGDLAYLHVHPHGDTPEPGETSGPETVFTASAPTPGRYLLYLDFRVGGEVRTAPFVLDTTTSTGHANGGGHDH